MANVSESNLAEVVSMSDDTDSTKAISHTEIYDVSFDSSSICSGVTEENLIVFLQNFSKIFVEKETKETKVISMALGVLQSSEGHDLVKQFISSIVAFFQDCFREAERENNDKQKAIKVEKVFAERRADGSQYIAAVQNVWDNLLWCLEQIPEDTNNEFSKASTTIIQQILQHFWSAKINKAQFNVKSDDQQTKIKSFSTICIDSSEHESIKDHAGWALKRTRDVLINGPNQIPLKETDEPTSKI